MPTLFAFDFEGDWSYLDCGDSGTRMAEVLHCAALSAEVGEGGPAQHCCRKPEVFSAQGPPLKYSQIPAYAAEKNFKTEKSEAK